MLSTVARSLPVHGYPGGELSELRAERVRKRIDALDIVIRNFADNGSRLSAAFHHFRHGIAQMGLLDWVADVFANDGQKRSILDALVRCHIASTPAGRQHLRELGEFPLKTGESSRFLFQKLNADARSVMLFPSTECPVNEGPQVFPCGLITVQIPGIGLRIPLMPACFGGGDGAITEMERASLLNSSAGEANSIRERLLLVRRALSPDAVERLAREHERDASAYAAGGRFDIAADLYTGAISNFASADKQAAVIRCLASSRDTFIAVGGFSEVLSACMAFAERCEGLGQGLRAKELRQKIGEFAIDVEGRGAVRCAAPMGMPRERQYRRGSVG
ncbi:hypothetical protein [Pandoraea sp. PE-S2T-3]|uniref:hypothetical protein n=1 Tax=Pandoraea sp. PE-S2T-3 TaxID=1986993 RepID=UPI000B3FB32B|nr:hypothetical protein [Pandoraea sp. PE-S2T-3]